MSLNNNIWMHLHENVCMFSGSEEEATQGFESPEMKEYKGEHRLGYVPYEDYDSKSESRNLIHFVETKKQTF